MVRGFVYLIALLLYSEDKECEDETRAKRTEATTVQESKTRQKKERGEKSGLSMTTRDGQVCRLSEDPEPSSNSHFFLSVNKIR
jgi:hypothetical protein